MDLLQDAAVGAVVGELPKALLDAGGMAAAFNSDFARLKETLDAVVPQADNIQSINGELDRPPSETSRLVALLKKGKDLVRKCANVHSFNIYGRYHCSKKILQLEQDLQRSVNVDLNLVMARDIKETLQGVRCTTQKLERLITEISARDGGDVWGAAMELPSRTVGLDTQLRELKDELLRDGVSVLVVCGQAGSGKTTLASKLCLDEEVRVKFRSNIFFATVSSNPNWMAIAKGYLKHLQQWVFGVSAQLESQDTKSAIKAFTSLLRQTDPQPTLLVLDDVWLDSASKFLSQELMERSLPTCCKILITSRFTFPNFGCTYHMRLLDEQDAMKLFNHLAFPEQEMHKPDNDLIKKVVSYCKGLPLAIVVVASSLRRQPEMIWRTTVRKWSKGQPIFDSKSNTDLLDRLTTSLEFIYDLVKEGFFDLGLFLEDQMIPATALIDIWTELYGIDEEEAFVILLDLFTQNLVRLVCTGKDVTEVEECYNDVFVTQHDLLRELAIYKSSQENIHQRKRILMKGNDFYNCSNEEPFGARLLSILPDAMSPSSWPDMKLPELEALILNISENCTLLPFLEEMSKVKVLIIINHACSLVELPHSRWLDYFSNLRRLRLEKVSIPSFDKIGIQMKSMRKITLVMCEIGEPLRNCSMEIANVMPGVVEIEIDYCYDLEEFSRGLCSLISLKKLSITNCHKLHSLPAEIGRMENLEAVRLHSCSGLVRLPKSIGNLKKLNFLDISGCISLRELPAEVGKLSGLRKLDMRHCSGLSELPATCVGLKKLEKVICDEETASLWNNFKIHLEELQVRSPKEKIDLNWLGM